MILSVIFLCSTFCASQKIDRQEYNKLVDYVCCKYANQHIIQHINSLNNKTSPSYKTDSTSYEDVIKDKIEGCTIDNCLKREELVNLLRKNNWATLANRISKIVSDIKYNDSSQNKVQIQSITEIISDKNLKETIKNELLTKYNGEGAAILSSNTTSPSSPQKQINELNVEIKELKEEIEKLKKKVSGLSTNTKVLQGLFGALILALLALVFFFLKISKSKKKKKHTGIADNSKPKLNNNNTNINEDALIKTIIDRILPDIDLRLYNYYNQTKDYFNQIEQRYLKQDKVDTQNNSKKPEPSEANVIYLKEREKMILFKDATKENAYYEIFDIRGENAKYKFCGNEERAIANYDAILKDVFDDETSPYFSKAIRVTHVEKGTVREKDGKWEIQTLAKIKFS